MEEGFRFEIEEWQAIPIEEMLTNINITGSLKDTGAIRENSPPQTDGRWVVTNGIKPVDLYVYLKARFGMPNGLTMLAKKTNDSDKTSNKSSQKLQGCFPRRLKSASLSVC